MAARDEIKKVFLKLARSGDCVHFVLPMFSTSDTPSSAVLIAPASVIIIFPPGVEVRDVSLGCILQHGGVEMAVVPIDELANCARTCFLRGGRNCFGSR